MPHLSSLPSTSSFSSGHTAAAVVLYAGLVLAIRAFTERHPDALRETLTFPADAAHRGGQLLPSCSAEGHNQDGFFYARLRKR